MPNQGYHRPQTDPDRAAIARWDGEGGQGGATDRAATRKEKVRAGHPIEAGRNIPGGVQVVGSRCRDRE
jgi:hypothetical protein